MISHFQKQSWESFFILVDFNQVIDSSDSLILSACEVHAWDSAQVLVDSIVLSLSSLSLGDSTKGGTNNTLKILILAGEEANSPYTITFYGKTVLGLQWEKDTIMRIKEIGPTHP